MAVAADPAVADFEVLLHVVKTAFAAPVVGQGVAQQQDITFFHFGDLFFDRSMAGGRLFPGEGQGRCGDVRFSIPHHSGRFQVDDLELTGAFECKIGGVQFGSLIGHIERHGLRFSGNGKAVMPDVAERAVLGFEEHRNFLFGGVGHFDRQLTGGVFYIVDHVVFQVIFCEESFTVV